MYYVWCAISHHLNTVCKYSKSVKFIKLSNPFAFAILLGSPWNIPVFDPKSVIVSGTGLDFVLVGKKAGFSIAGGGELADELVVNITGNMVHCVISTHKNEYFIDKWAIWMKKN